MKNTNILTIVMMTVGILITTSACAMDERKSPEIADAYWRHFGPAPSNDWTAARRLPVKRSLEQSIRHDALRRYESNSFELSESGQVISFSEKPDFYRVDPPPHPTKRQPGESPLEVFELAESGQTIVFPKTTSPAKVDVNLVARQDAASP